jgi:nucleoside-diphosphate-sugar epimerase
MKILIVGGTGMIGGHAAEHLIAAGHDVVLAARKPAPAATPMARMPVLLGDYAAGTFTRADLAPFEAIVFAAGQDIRHIPRDADPAAFWQATQIGGVPDFVRLARDAGVGRLVQIGSYYHQKMPHLAETNPYVRARKLADEGARALATADFNVCTLNPPSIIGVTPGLPAKRYEGLTAWARGLRPEIPATAPPGGTNYMSVRSLSEAIAGALQHGESGRAYLVGDRNLRFRDFFQMFFDAVGNPVQVEEVDAEHPLLPDAFIVPGRGSVLAYDTDPDETRRLGYRQDDVRNAVTEVVRLCS